MGNILGLLNKTSNTLPFLPSEIIMDILIRLPIQSLLRMKSVRKHWNALITDRYFMENHMLRCSFQFFYDADFVTNDETFDIVCSRDGLVLKKSNATGNYCIQNPATKKTMHIPNPHHSAHPCINFTYVASANQYKLVNTYRNGDKEIDDYDGCEILTLESDKSWRPIKFPTLFPDLDKETEEISVVNAVGSLHFIRVIQNGSKICKEIVSLDLESETFTTVSTLPQNLFSTWNIIWTMNWNGDLGFGHEDEQGNFHVFVLKDYRRLTWDKEIVIPLVEYLRIKPESFAYFIPVYSDYGNFRFWITDLGLFNYKIAPTKDVVKVFSLPRDSKENIYCSFVSIISLKGME